MIGFFTLLSYYAVLLSGFGDNFFKLMLIMLISSYTHALLSHKTTSGGG